MQYTEWRDGLGLARQTVRRWDEGAFSVLLPIHPPVGFKGHEGEVWWFGMVAVGQ